MRKVIATLVISNLISPTAIAQRSEAHLQDRIALAKEYSELTYLKKITQDTSIKETRLAWRAAGACSESECWEILDKSIIDAVERAYVEYENSIVQLIASKLSRDQLRETLKFSRSPAGRALASINQEMTGDFADINHAFTLRTSEDIYRSFCAQRPKECAQITAAKAGKPDAQ